MRSITMRLSTSTTGCQVRAPDEDDGKVLDLPRLNQRQRLEQFIERAQLARKGNESIGVLEEEHLPHEEVPAGNPSIEIRVGLLLGGKADVAPHGTPASLFGPRFAASISPGPPPVMTVNPSAATRRPSARPIA